MTAGNTGQNTPTSCEARRQWHVLLLYGSEDGGLIVETPDARSRELVVDSLNSENAADAERLPNREEDSRRWRKPQWRARHVRMGC